MARVTQKDRDEAVEFIKQALNDKMAALREKNAQVLEDMEETADNLVEREFHLKSMMREVSSLRKQADEIERRAYEVVGTRNLGYFIEQRVREKKEELLAQSKVGKDLAKLEFKYKHVRREVFLATGHEELVALVREASK